VEYIALKEKIKNNYIKGIAYDSRKVMEGYIFVCIEGFKTDGHNYAKNAIEKGASIIVAEKTLDTGSAELVIVKNTRKALAELSSLFYNYPSEKLNIYGVTGTNGKTTVTYMIENIMKEAGLKTGIIGTIENRIGDTKYKTANTTPESFDLQELFSLMAKEDVKAVAMEVSSHALFLSRVWNCYFNGVIYTNFSQDHLDFHGSLEEYWKTKATFLELQKKFRKNNVFSVFNGDDTEVAKLVNEGNGKKFVYSIGETKLNGGITGVFASGIRYSGKGTTFTLNIDGEKEEFNIKLMGKFNIYNALAAICTGIAENIDIKIIKNALEKMDPVNGRIYPVDGGQDFTCIVDYAHTPDGLEKILTASREFTKGEIITVFGCGGDRDKSKRPLMGNIASGLSDKIILTSDNPRSEDPERIIEDIEKGIKNKSYLVEIDRKKAIEKAVNMAKKGDCLVVAGKGHEDYQIFKDRTIHFDDCEVLREAIRVKSKK